MVEDSQVELEELECLLLKQGVNLGVLWTNYIDRFTKTDGVICCGGLTTCIAKHLEVSTGGIVPDIGEMRITYEALFAMKVLKVDDSSQGFFIERADDHFSVPNPQLTQVDVWTNDVNWKLNTPIHRRCIEATPNQGEFRKRNIPRLTKPYVENEAQIKGGIEVYQGHNDEEVDGGNDNGEEEAEPEVEHQRRWNRARARHPRPISHYEFQRDVTAQLGTMYSYMQYQSTVWDERWVAQQEDNAFNRQSWASYGDWRLVEEGYWEAQRLQDVQQRQQVEALQR